MNAKHFLIASIIAIVGIALLFTTDSAFADKHNLNTLQTVLGIMLVATGAVWIAYNYKNQGGNPDKR